MIIYFLRRCNSYIFFDIAYHFNPPKKKKKKLINLAINKMFLFSTHKIIIIITESIFLFFSKKKIIKINKSLSTIRESDLKGKEKIKNNKQTQSSENG